MVPHELGTALELLGLASIAFCALVCWIVTQYEAQRSVRLAPRSESDPHVYHEMRTRRNMRCSVIASDRATY